MGAAVGALSLTRKRFNRSLWFLMDYSGPLVVLSLRHPNFSLPAFKRPNKVLIDAFQSIFCSGMMVRGRERRD